MLSVLDLMTVWNFLVANACVSRSRVKISLPLPPFLLFDIVQLIVRRLFVVLKGTLHSKLTLGFFNWPKSLYYCDLSLTNCTFVKLELRVQETCFYVTLGNLTGVVALTWKFGANAYTAMNLMGAWFKRRCTARGGDAARRRPSADKSCLQSR